ncbi:MAG: hypothetical protein H7Z43_08690 [Clostridia bacterium]|nr:hypothetical protein [Deltaproteobacteria bacterium]
MRTYALQSTQSVERLEATLQQMTLGGRQPSMKAVERLENVVRTIEATPNERLQLIACRAMVAVLRESGRAALSSDTAGAATKTHERALAWLAGCERLADVFAPAGPENARMLLAHVHTQMPMGLEAPPTADGIETLHAAYKRFRATLLGSTA